MEKTVDLGIDVSSHSLAIGNLYVMVRQQRRRHESTDDDGLANLAQHKCDDLGDQERRGSPHYA